MIQKWVQLKFSRTDGRSWATGVQGFGESVLNEAREMAQRLTKSPATDFIEVSIEHRDGAFTVDSERHTWSRSSGWQ